jgi:Ca-activated chloride channel family protein
VTFSNAAEIAVPLAFATAEARSVWNRSVDDVFAAGGTFMGSGLALGLDTLERAHAAGRSPRAILISDGLAAEPHGVLRAHAVRSAVAEVPLSAVGVGADFDENLMSTLADVGTGNYYFLRDADQLASVFTAEFATARETVASAVRVMLEPAAGVSVVDAAGYPLAFAGSVATFQPGTLFAGQERRVWVTLRVPTDTTGEYAVGAVRVQYRRDGDVHRLAMDDFPAIACVRDPDRFFASVDSDVWEQSVIVEEYNQLRQSVAGLVAGGRAADAEAEIDRFVDRNAAMNRVVASPGVAHQIDAAAELKAEVADAFRGDDAPGKSVRDQAPHLCAQMLPHRTEYRSQRNRNQLG